MTCFDYRKYNTKNLIAIGKSGGWTKPSTGYTFNSLIKNQANCCLLCKQIMILENLKRKRFWYYDRIFLDVLYYHNHLGSYLF